MMRLYDLKRELTYMRLAVTPLQDVLSQLVRTPGTLVAPEVRLYFRDVLDHSMRRNETLDALRAMLGPALTVHQPLAPLPQGEVGSSADGVEGTSVAVRECFGGHRNHNNKT